MKVSVSYRMILMSAALLMMGFSSQVSAQALFTDDFEDRVNDQARVGNNWTWFEQTFEGDTCTGDPITEYGPYSDGNGSDYVVENRNYYTASNDVGQGDSYFRAGLEVPAWDGALTNMLRVYGNQYIEATTCERVLVFQEYTLEEAGTYTFSFDVAQDRFGAPENGEITAAFIKVLRQSDTSYTTLMFETKITTPPPATSPEDVTTASQYIEFTVPAEMVGELLQFGFYNDLSEGLGQSPWTSAALYDNVMLAPMPIGPAHSGSWFNTDQSGHGFSIEFGTLNGMPQAIVYWYTYDSEGNPIFMVGSGTPVDNRVEVTFVSPVGMEYGVFDPNSVVREDGGTAVLEFSDRNNATFSYTPSAFSASNWGHTTPIESLPLEKLFGLAADNYYPMPN